MFGRILRIGVIFEYHVHIFNKDKGIDSYITQGTLWAIHWFNTFVAQLLLTAVRLNLYKKYFILLSNVSIIVYKAGKCTGLKNNKLIHLNLSAGSYSTDDFNAKIKVAILQKRQDWEPPQIKDLRLVIPEHYKFMASNTIFTAFGILDNYLEETTPIRATLPPLVHIKHSLLHQLLQNYCYCTVKKSTKLKTSWMVSHQLCWPAYTLLVIGKLFLECI